MKNNRVSERYAKAFFQLSIKDNLLNDVKSDIDYLKKLFSSSREISHLYINPIIPIYHKIEITNRIFKGKLNDLTLRMMLNVIYRKRDNLIENILLKFNEIYNDYTNIVESEIITTSKLDDENLEYIKSFARKIIKKNIFLKEKIDNNIIGGFNLKVGDKMYDCTVSKKIKEIKKILINK
jgi:F-type H+-transporting ATPase subunit delta